MGWFDYMAKMNANRTIKDTFLFGYFNNYKLFTPFGYFIYLLSEFVYMMLHEPSEIIQNILINHPFSIKDGSKLYKVLDIWGNIWEFLYDIAHKHVKLMNANQKYIYHKTLNEQFYKYVEARRDWRNVDYYKEKVSDLEEEARKEQLIIELAGIKE